MILPCHLAVPGCPHEHLFLANPLGKKPGMLIMLPNTLVLRFVYSN